MPALRWLTTATVTALMAAIAHTAPISSDLATTEAQDTPTWSVQQGKCKSAWNSADKNDGDNIFFWKQFLDELIELSFIEI